MRPIVALLLACSLPCSAQATEWHPFRWYMSSLAGGPVERVALLLPAKINGVDCQVQLDTGANGELIWARQASSPQPGAQQPVPIELAGIRKNIPAEPANLELLTAEVCAAGPIATVGNGFFEHGTLTLDLGRARFAFAPQPQLAGKPEAQPLFYARTEGRGGGHTLVEIKRPGGKAGYALLDTGSARFGLVATSLQEWNELSGDMPLDEGPRVKKFSVQSWGRQVPCYETALSGGFEVGGVSVPQAIASYCVDQGFKSPVKLLGVLGLRPLGDRVITLDYLSRRWSLSAAPQASSTGL
jgi:hypothetical protein